MFTVNQVAARLGVSPGLVYGWCEEHLLPHYRVGCNGKRGHIRIAEADLEEFLRARRVEPDQQDPAPQRSSPVKLKHLKIS